METVESKMTASPPRSNSPLPSSFSMNTLPTSLASPECVLGRRAVARGSVRQASEEHQP